MIKDVFSFNIIRILVLYAMLHIRYFFDHQFTHYIVEFALEGTQVVCFSRIHACMVYIIIP